MLTKVVVIVLLLAIVASLLGSMVFLVKDPSTRTRTLTGLKLRVALSVTLVLFLLLAHFMGWINPHPALPPAP